jgi:hypothetical protein
MKYHFTDEFFKNIFIMDPVNYLLKNFSVCNATRRKGQNKLKDRAIKTLFSRGIPKSL